MVKNSKCINGLCDAAKQYFKENLQRLDLYSRRVKHIENAEFIDATIQRVYVSNLPGMRVAFDVALELEVEVSEVNRHNVYSAIFSKRTSSRHDITPNR